MREFIRKINNWLLPVMIILFVLEVFTFPFVVYETYSSRSDNPDHILTYTTNKLKWDSNTNINRNGYAELSLFDMVYGENAKSSNLEKIIAPGLDNTNIIRLRNASDSKIQYTAVLYKKVTDNKVPVEINMLNGDFIETDTYYLPEELKNVDVVRAVKGTLSKSKTQDFDINWKWKFYVSDKQDLVDTMLGNKIDMDEVCLGFYLVVSDDNVDDDKPGGGGGGSIIVITPPKDPDTPDEPDVPDVPDIPDEPDTPVNPDDPDLPDVPEKPDTPDEPHHPDIPDIPDIPDEPEQPGVGKEPGTGQIITPEVPKTGDVRLFETYITLMIISGMLLMIMIIEKVLEKKRK